MQQKKTERVTGTLWYVKKQRIGKHDRDDPKAWHSLQFLFYNMEVEFKVKPITRVASTPFRWLSCWNTSQILWLYQLILWKRYKDRIKLFQSSRPLLENKWDVTNCVWISLLTLAKYVTNSHFLHSDWISSARSGDCHYFLPFLSLQHINYSDNTQLSSKSGWVCEAMRTGNP